MRSFGRHCPLSRGAEIHGGAPAMYRTLPAQRSRPLGHRGIVARRPGPSGRGHACAPAGAGLAARS